MGVTPQLAAGPARSWALPVRTPVPWATLTVGIAALAVWLQPGIQPSLVFERSMLTLGQVWRLWTAHVVHWSGLHLFWNLAVFLPAGMWTERLAPGRLRALLMLAPVAISGVLYLFVPLLDRYAGLSGVGTAVVTLLALTQLGREPGERWIWQAVLALVALKCGFEFFEVRPLFARFAQSDMRSVPIAHLTGAAFAVVFYGVRRRPLPHRGS